jgi:hypothetical protein
MDCLVRPLSQDTGCSANHLPGLRNSGRRGLSATRGRIRTSAECSILLCRMLATAAACRLSPGLARHGGSGWEEPHRGQTPPRYVPGGMCMAPSRSENSRR